MTPFLGWFFLAAFVASLLMSGLIINHLENRLRDWERFHALMRRLGQEMMSNEPQLAQCDCAVCRRDRGESERTKGNN